jgi:hypothetical protein
VYIVLGILGLLLLAYAGGMFWAVRRGRTIPRSAYLGLLVINAAVVGVVVVWIATSNKGA